jgi:hypothetical protein
MACRCSNPLPLASCAGAVAGFLGGGQRAVRGLLVSAGSGPAGRVAGGARLAAPPAGRGRVAWGRACRGGWVLFLGRWPARCARVAGQRGLRARGPCCVERTTRFASCWQGREVAWGRACRGGWVFFLGGGGQRAVRGSLVSAGLGPRVLLCGAHDSLRLVLEGGGWRGGACCGGRVFFWGGGGQRAVRGLLASAGFGPAGLVVWSARLAAPRAGRGARWRGGAGSRDLQRATPFSLSRPARALRAGGLRPSSSLDRCASA